MGMWTVLEVVLLGAMLMYASVSCFIIEIKRSIRPMYKCY